MSISTIRRYTTDDEANVEAAAERFCARHQVTKDWDGQTWEQAVEQAVDRQAWTDRGLAGASPRLAYLWQKCYCRALGESYDRRLTVGWGHVGISAE